MLGSIPSGSTRGSSSFGRAQPCQGWGGQFEPGLPLKRTLMVEVQNRCRLVPPTNLGGNSITVIMPSFQVGYAGSIPASRSNLLPDGVMVSTTDFDSVCIGSSPVRVTNN